MRNKKKSTLGSIYLPSDSIYVSSPMLADENMYDEYRTART